MTFPQNAARAEPANLPSECGGPAVVMSSNMLKIGLVLLICLHFSYGSDPQPEQIHLSSTGNSSFKYIKERNVVN